MPLRRPGPRGGGGTVARGSGGAGRRLARVPPLYAARALGAPTHRRVPTVFGIAQNGSAALPRTGALALHGSGESHHPLTLPATPVPSSVVPASTPPGRHNKIDVGFARPPDPASSDAWALRGAIPSNPTTHRDRRRESSGSTIFGPSAARRPARGNWPKWTLGLAPRPPLDAPTSPRVGRTRPPNPSPRREATAPPERPGPLFWEQEFLTTYWE